MSFGKYPCRRSRSRINSYPPKHELTSLSVAFRSDKRTSYPIPNATLGDTRQDARETLLGDTVRRRSRLRVYLRVASGSIPLRFHPCFHPDPILRVCVRARPSIHPSIHVSMRPSTRATPPVSSFVRLSFRSSASPGQGHGGPGVPNRREVNLPA